MRHRSLCGVMVLLIRLLMGVRGGHCLRADSRLVNDDGCLKLLAQRARSLGLRTSPALMMCQNLAVPTVIGVLRPTIILPMSLVTGLRSDQLEAILIHELAHIKRCDYLVNLAQRIVEAVADVRPTARVMRSNALPGAGSAPGVTMPSMAVTVDGDVLRTLRTHTMPVIARTRDDVTSLDLRSVDPSDDEVVIAALRQTYGPSS